MAQATSLNVPVREVQARMPNERLRTTLLESDYNERALADELGLDPKSIQRWITRDVTPRRTTAHRAAKLLGVPPSWLWPELEQERESASSAEIVTLYPHRSEVPRHLWLDLLANATQRVWLYANASLFLPEDNPESIGLIQRKSENGTEVRILMADPDSPQCITRGIEEQLFDAIPARVRMALSYYSPLADTPGIDFRLQKETLYNSIFVYDDEMLINQHVYGMYGYMAPILHLRRMQGGDFFDMYIRSFERVWEVSSPIQESNFWRQRVAAINRSVANADHLSRKLFTASTAASVSQRSGNTISAPSALSDSALSDPEATPITCAPPLRPACISRGVSPMRIVFVLSNLTPYFAVARSCATPTRFARTSSSEPYPPTSKSRKTSSLKVDNFTRALAFIFPLSTD